MKILITGYTSRMNGSTRLHYDYVTFTFLLEDMIKELGHEVDRRQVVIPEHLSEMYDYAFCGIAPLSSLSAGRIPETHYAIEEMRGRCSIFADDWSFVGWGGSARYAIDRWDDYIH